MRIINLKGKKYVLGATFVNIKDKAIESYSEQTRRVVEDLRDKEYEKGTDLTKLDFYTAKNSEQFAFIMVDKSENINLPLLSFNLNIPRMDFAKIFKLIDINGTSFYWAIVINEHGLIVLDFESSEYDLAASKFNFYKVHLTDKRKTEEKDKAKEVQKQLLQSAESSLEFIASLLDFRIFRTQLRKYGENNSNLVAKIAIIIVFFLILFAAYFYYDYQEQEALRIEYEQAALKERLYKEDIAKHPEQFFNLNFSSAKSVEESIMLCVPKILSVPTFSAGWQLDKTICNNKGLSITWVRTKDSDFMLLPVDSTLVSTDQALTKISFEEIKQDKTNKDYTKLYDQKYLERIFYQLAKNLNLHTKLSFSHAEEKLIEGVSITSPWVKGNFELNDLSSWVLLDRNFIQSLSIYGLTISSIETDLSLLWKIKGEIYAKVAR